jgi:hypothetical protein
MPKLYLELEQNMETNPSTHPWAVQKMDNLNRYSYTYAKIYILLTVSLSNGRRLTELHRSTYDNGKKERLIISKVAVETG